MSEVPLCSTKQPLVEILPGYPGKIPVRFLNG